MFHSLCGERIQLLNENRTALRDTNEFNHGLVFGNEPLKSNYLFEVKIEQKVFTWSGGLEIGITKCDPELIDIPANASDLNNGTWLLSGSSVLKDGRSVLDIYGLNLNTIQAGDVIGVMKTYQDQLVFFINGICKGIAAYHIPFRVFVVIDLYGQVAQASVVSYSLMENIQFSTISSEIDTLDESEITEGNSVLSNLVTNFDLQTTLAPQNVDDISPVHPDPALVRDKIRFHSRCGTLAKISSNGRSAERIRPFDEFNNGVVITHRPLFTNELYEIRIDRLVEKWSGSIEVGITMHNPDFLEFPPTMTNLKSGTIMMSGCGILTNGKATKRDYGDYNLDELTIGDRIGLVRNSSGDLHYFINGLDQGVAASNVPVLFWGVVDLYGRTVKVTIVDRNDRHDNTMFRKMTLMHGCHLLHSLVEIDEEESQSLLFHKKCGQHVAVTNGGRTAYRPNALEDFNYGVVLTSRPLRPNEPFEVKLDKVVTRWAGSIEIGVTSHSPVELEFPSTMTNIRTGTWMMTGNGVMHNGTTVMDDYGINLDRLQAGDRVAVVIKNNGMLHLYVNGVDQGEVNANISTPMYGVIDLYGQAAQATILEYDVLYNCVSPSEIIIPLPFAGPIDLSFHYNHGKNVRVCNNGRTAVTTKPLGEIADAVVVGSRPIRTNEMFSISVDRIEQRSSSVEAAKCHILKLGVTTMTVDDLELPATMTDLDNATWILSGSNIMKDGIVIKYNYSLNLDNVRVGSVIGLMRHRDGSLHYYWNEIDQGEACNQIPENVFPVIDLYGKCAQVTIVSPPEGQAELSETSNDQCTNWEDVIQSVPSNQTLFDGPPKCFSQWCGKNITLSDDLTIATRSSQHNYGIVFSNFILEQDKLHEICITKWNSKYAGSMSLGVTNIQPEKFPLPPTISCLKPDVWYLNGDEVWHNGRIIKAHYGHNLHWLQCWSTVGVKYCSDGTLHFYVNGQDQGVAASDISGDLYIIIDLYGSVTEVTVNREVKDIMTSSLLPSINIAESIVSPSSSTTQETLMVTKDGMDDLKAERAIMEYNMQKNFEKEKSMKFPPDLIAGNNWSFFQELRGRNIKLLNNGKTALRTESYNQGVVIASKPVERDALFEITIDNLNSRWVSSLMIGILCSPLSRSSVPVTAFGFKRDIWLIAGDCVYHNGNKIKSRYGCNLDLLSESQKVGITVDSNHHLKLFVDDIDQGVAAANIPPVCYIILDLYGQCEQVTIANEDTFVEQQPDLVPLQIPAYVSPDPVSCEKADLDRHEKESPSQESVNLLLKPDKDDGAVSRIKLNKTNENTAVAASYSSESHLKLNKTNENTAVMSSSNHSMVDSLEFHSKANKTNDNSVIASCSMVDFHAQHVLTSLTSSSSSTSSVNVSEECDSSKHFRKSLSVSEHSALQPPQPQHADLTRHMSSTNCDHKTSLDIANTMYIQAEKSSQKVKNNKNRTPSPLNDRPMKQNPNCEYRLRCYRFRNFLGLPAGFFASESSILCYCTSCCPYVAHEMKGDPPSSFSLPNGWCKFPLKKHLMTNNVDAVTLERWHVAFIGVSVGNVRRILDSGQLLAPDKLKVGFASKDCVIKDEDDVKYQLILSPVIKYASNVEFAPRYEYIDQKTKTPYTCSAAFQVLVRPGSYKVGPPSLNISSKIDPGLSTNNIEWVVKENESTVLSALLFKIENS